MGYLNSPKISRRSLLQAGGAAIATTFLPSLPAAGPGGRAFAQASSVGAPELDELSIRVVTDGLSYALAGNLEKDNLTVERPGHFLSPDNPPDGALIGEFGLALHAEARRGEEVRNILVDFGYTSQALNNNLDLLGIDVSSLDALVLSHGHYDHFGGLVGFLDKHKGRLKENIPFFIGDEEAFCHRDYIRNGNNYGVLDRRAIEDAGLNVVFSNDPMIVAEHAFSTGQIPQESFEKVLSPTRFHAGVQDGLGCAHEDLPADKQNAEGTPDDFEHEIATSFIVKGKGLVVLTSCGHRGVVNSVERARDAAGVDKVHAVIGGFHLQPHDDEYIRQTISGLDALDVDHVVPLHCSGERFYELARQEIPDRLVRAYVGSKLKFSA